MKINENTLLEGQRVLLVPYNAEHVPRYHEWMKSPELQQLTASEPLTLEQEYDMQRSWREDDDSTESSVFAPKTTPDNQTETTFHNTVDFPECTFIILDTQKWADPSVNEETCMVGDVNIFLTDSTDPSLAELEIMIAEESYRGKGIGKEVTLMMMCYGVNKLGIKRFQAKIGLDNHTSIAMFKKLHFQEVSVCQVFKEVTLELTVDESVQKTLLEEVQMKERDYRQTCSGRRAQKGQNDTQAS
ncbi:N-acetyltransferase 9 isoform X1 [Oryzias latipes]|uniref:N-acetyltransferase 9 isoform X1 n=1 Tax=Oryzias latipes TaxID=8090 RepID=UPI0005CBB03A|nr:N-acetyltransferase 9 isoform X1 [Oryzias latipes]